MQDEALDQVKAILGCDTTTARALLIYFSWDTEAVLGERRLSWAACECLPHRREPPLFLRGAGRRRLCCAHRSGSSCWHRSMNP
jgi:hypothetical protein